MINFSLRKKSSYDDYSKNFNSWWNYFSWASFSSRIKTKPLWLSYKRNMPGFLNVSIEKALKAGLTLRPISETIKAVLDEDKEKIDKIQNGLNAEKERMLLNEWKEISQNPGTF